ncbi:MAG: cyclodeaminase/cyclohydrolase family protein [Oscillospiraceae bacterium]|nr:cyclodeaminase/cyclohydrolase family protein [Oscillospiraceae bacterium]
MLLVDYTIKGFADLLASDAPAPGGGSTAALEGALGASLARMVGALTVGRKKYAEHADFADDLTAKTERIRTDFLAVIDEDTLAFNQVSAVFEMPKDTDEQKAARKEAMQSALKSCVLPPFKMMQLSLEAIELTAQAVGKTNASAASDLGVAALSLKAAVQGAWLNILINIGGLSDTGFADEYRQKGEGILSKALPLADEVYNAILGDLISQA